MPCCIYTALSGVMPVKSVRRLFVLFLSVSVLLTLGTIHFKILPGVAGGYNDECLTSTVKIAALRNLLINTTKLLERAGITYWLDYGTLLAAVRDGELIPWDHDADIGYFASDSLKINALSKIPVFVQDLLYAQIHIYNGHNAVVYLTDSKARESGIELNALVARCNGVQIDMFRYWTTSSGGKSKLYTKFNSDGTFMRWYRMYSAFPSSWLLPLKGIRFLGTSMSIPNKAEDLLTFRYPVSWRLGIRLPYRWKCLLPW